ncbi:hypothetical protein [Klebsiella pneumoniae]|uniref:hypothetical protein n=1 Tax=Klebsiella pneumoniae TaxID=573 RepID=UPI0038909D6A
MLEATDGLRSPGLAEYYPPQARNRIESDKYQHFATKLPDLPQSPPGLATMSTTMKTKAHGRYRRRFHSGVVEIYTLSFADKGNRNSYSVRTP